MIQESIENISDLYKTYPQLKNIEILPKDEIRISLDNGQTLNFLGAESMLQHLDKKPLPAK